MLKRIATVFGYAKAPKATFMMKHPVKGTKALLAAKGAKALVTTRAGAMVSAAVALPIGFFAVRKLAHSGGDRQA